MLEVGSGPFTQSRHILNLFPFVPIESVTLVDPNLDNYRKLPNCFYRNGSLAVYPVTTGTNDILFPGRIHGEYWYTVETILIASTTEDLHYNEAFDTVVSINVLEHVHDAVAYLTNLYRAVKSGGLLIFHDRWFDQANDAEAVLGSFSLHPVRVSKLLLLQFLSKFYPNANTHDDLKGNTQPEGLLFSSTPTQEMIDRGFGELGLYVIAIKQ